MAPPDLAYWKKQLEDLPAELPLPFDRPRRAVPASAGAAETIVIPADRARPLHAFAATHQATPFMLHLAVLQTLLHRYTGEKDIVVGALIPGRSRLGLAPATGLFVNTLILRGDLSGNPTFTDVIRRARQAVIDALAHQETPIEEVVEALRPDPDAPRIPLARILLTDRDVPGLTFGDARAEVFERHSHAVEADLALTARETDGALHIRADYQTELFDPGTIQRLLGHFSRLLEGILHTPDARISELPLLSAEEDAWLRRVGTDTSKAYPRDASVHELFARIAADQPDLPAITFRGRTRTYAQLDETGARIARRLRDAGVGIGDVVALVVERSDDAVAGMLGVLSAGAAYLPADPHLPTDRLDFQLRDANARVVLTDTRFVAELAAPDRTVLDVNGQADAAGTGVRERVSAEDLAYVMYTSGSTGVPKGVAIPHRGIVRLVWADVVPIGAGDSVLQLAPLSFDLATFEIWVPLLRGARTVVYPAAELDLAVLERVIRDEHITHLWLTTSLFNGVVDARPEVLRGVTWLLAGGEALSPSHVRRAFDACPSLRVINGYGPTESTTFASVFEVPRPVLARRALHPDRSAHRQHDGARARRPRDARADWRSGRAVHRRRWPRPWLRRPAGAHGRTLRDAGSRRCALVPERRPRALAA